MAGPEVPTEMTATASVSDVCCCAVLNVLCGVVLCLTCAVWGCTVLKDHTLRQIVWAAVARFGSLMAHQ